MAIEDVPSSIAEFILGITNQKMLVLMISIFLLFAGTFMEALAAIVILTPELLPWSPGWVSPPFTSASSWW